MTSWRLVFPETNFAETLPKLLASFPPHFPDLHIPPQRIPQKYKTRFLNFSDFQDFHLWEPYTHLEWEEIIS